MNAHTLTIDRLDTPAGIEVAQTTRDEWIELASEFLDHNFRQCWDYAAKMAARSSAGVENVVVRRGDEPLGLASVRVKRLPGLRTGIAYVSGGPLVRHAEGETPGARLALVLSALRQEYVERRRLVLRVAPTIGDADWNAAQAAAFEAAGFARADDPEPYRTVLVDIGRPLADIRAGFAQKWRNCLNKSERQDLRVTEGRDPQLFADFMPLFDELVARKAFDVDLGADFYAELQAELPESERLYVAIAWVDDEPAAGIVASTHGDTPVYLLGASNDAGRKRNAAYLLQWKVIEEAARAGCRWYDLGGVDAEANPGVYKFKLGMGGTELCAAGPYELAPDRLRATAVRTAERLVRALRRR
jgi:Acetyltransferase (GNAT) domain